MLKSHIHTVHTTGSESKMSMSMSGGDESKRLRASGEWEEESESEVPGLGDVINEPPPLEPGGLDEFASEVELRIEISFEGDDTVLAQYLIQAVRAVENGLYRSQVQAIEEIESFKEPETKAALDSIAQLRNRQFVIVRTSSGSFVLVGTVTSVALGMLLGHVAKKIFEKSRTGEYLINRGTEKVRALEDAAEAAAKECAKSLQRNFDIKKKAVKHTAMACVLTYSIVSKELRDELEKPNRDKQ